MATVTTPAANPAATTSRVIPLGTLQAITLPLTFIVALAAVSLLPAIRENPNLRWSILGAAGALLIGLAAIQWRVLGRPLTLDVQLRPQHYLQACAQSTVLLYWGYYWRPVYEALPLLLAQLLFAYAFDILLAWSRRNSYTLGFAPFPVIFSINLFLWFKPDWFYLQFLMIAVGFAAKELIRWNKDGRRTHIFNPSSFPLAVFSLALILTGTTSITWGPEIARTQFNPPNIYLLLFLVGLPGQLLFGVTTMTMSAVVTTYLFGLAYYGVTGTYYFIDNYIPVAVFLGMHLLFTDPSTSPRTESGRIIFGMIYGLGNILLYAVLGRLGIPTFYDKLLPVPIMNLSIKAIDHFARSPFMQRLDVSQLGRSLTGRKRNLAYVSVWTAVFIGMSAAEGVGDHHPGHSVVFWQQACESGKYRACETLASIEAVNCRDGSGWACNEHGLLTHKLTGVAVADDFTQACMMGFSPACRNSATVNRGIAPTARGVPGVEDYQVLLRTGKGPIPETTPDQILTRACREGWMAGCEDLAGLYLRGMGVARDGIRAAAAYETACSGGRPMSCSNLGLMHYKGDGVQQDAGKGLMLLKRACELEIGRAHV